MIGDESVDILLVEDNPGDAFLCVEMLKEVRTPTCVHVVSDGVKALSYLRKEGVYEDVPTPDMILLDLNLPRLSGHDLLRIIKSDPELKLIPVVVMSSSDSREDIVAAYAHHANCYLTKPLGLDQFITVVRSIDAFWLTVARLPGHVTG